MVQVNSFGDLPTPEERLETFKRNQTLYMVSETMAANTTGYEFQEYPKWVTPPGGQPRIVASRAEEDEAMGTAKEKKKPK